VDKVRWAESALRDLKGIHDFIARDSPWAATAMAARIVDATERIGDFPLSGRKIPEFPDSPYREAIVASYRVIYRPDNTVVWIETVVHGSRLLKLPHGG
jgi:addiction module RelE/StbE family toxin